MTPLRNTVLCLMLLGACYPVSTHAASGSGTILETDDAIIVEYYGNPEDLKAARLIEERERKAAEAEAEKQREKVEKSREMTKAKQSARMAEVARKEEEARQAAEE